MAECCDISLVIQKDYDAAKETYDNLLEVANKFKRGTEVFALRIDKDNYTVKTGIINSVTYSGKAELSFSVRRCDIDGHTDYTISTKSWEMFDNAADLLERLGTLINPTTTTATTD